MPKRARKSVEQIYQKKTQKEHILLRPDTYVGSIEHQDDHQWIWDSKKDAMEYKKITYVPALYKIFDEILVNAADNLQRDPRMNGIKVDIDPKKNRIRVWNNGKGLPIAIHKKHKVFFRSWCLGTYLRATIMMIQRRKSLVAAMDLEQS
jgi:DNA topoisomerase-2